jgi:hypothetical protein
MVVALVVCGSVKFSIKSLLISYVTLVISLYLTWVNTVIGFDKEKKNQVLG